MSSLKGNINQVRKRVDKIYQDLNKSIPMSRVSFQRESLTENPSAFTNATNGTGEDLDAFSCLRLVDGDSPLEPAIMVYPEDTDDEENSIYCTLLNDTPSDSVGIVQIFGRTIKRLAVGDFPVIVGEKLYPLKNTTENKGKVGNKTSFPNDIIGNGIGRALVGEASDSELIEMNLISAGGGAGGSGIENCFAATTGNFTFSDTPIVDGFLSTSGRYCVWLQDDDTENGIWTFDSTKDVGSRWTKTKSFTADDAGIIINVSRGLINGQTLFACFGENKIFPFETRLIPCRGVSSVISGLSSQDGNVPVAGEWWLVQSSGVYVASSGSWRKIISLGVDDGTAACAKIGSLISIANGTLYGQTCFIVKNVNTTSGLGAYFK